MEMLPPVGWADVATKRDLDVLEERVNLRFEVTEQKILATLRGELLTQTNALNGQFTAQTRTLLFANVGTVLSLAAVVFGATKLA